MNMARGEFLMAPFLDLLVHTWDLAKGTRQNTTLNGGLVEECYGAFAPQMAGMLRTVMLSDGRPVLGPEVKVPADASVQDKLIGVMGRRS